ncbi:MAG: glycosyltransferase family 87 protein [Chloroherpetonaceae bacterium]|nr:DUF2029 domain-containing protein [Chloroherpetonaceae bacterium]MCS7211405.1 DUF2029 domain-containing protein [Chloroherpetonaceae bacterium]MDW8465676.1 glycosyltransferase family 87 protein [Chloroherpetonaceae bacterium]
MLARLRSNGFPILRIGLYVLIAVAILLEAIKPIHRGKDLGVFIHAARLMLEKKNIYQIPTPEGHPYKYPPFYAVLHIPLVFVPVELAVVAWNVFTVVLFSLSLRWFYEYLTGETFSTLPLKQQWILGTLTTLLCARFVLYHLTLAQANIPVMALSIWALRCLRQNKAIAGGFWLGLAIAIKLLVAPLAFWLLLQRRVRALGGVMLGVAASVLFPTIVLGVETNVAYHRDWLQDFFFGKLHRLEEWTDVTNVSPHVQLYRWFSDAVAFEHNGNPVRLTLWHISPEMLQLASALLTLALLSIIPLYAFCFRNYSALVREGGGAALVFALIPLLASISQKHYFVLLMPSCLYAAYLWHLRRLQSRRFYWLVALFFATTTLTADGFCGMYLSQLLTGHGILPFGVLLMIAALFCAGFDLEKTLHAARSGNGESNLQRAMVASSLIATTKKPTAQ